MRGHMILMLFHHGMDHRRRASRHPLALSDEWLRDIGLVPYDRRAEP